ncbi:CDPF1 protein, partial [Pomatostomus ruficeps]|nr:CDPF1 protein [Pomatostomus ruficeps]
MNAPKEVQTPGEFECELCELSALYTYYGQTPPNSRSVVLLEEAYVMKDPFTPDKDKFLIAESHRSLGSRAVCVGAVASKTSCFNNFFFLHTPRFCLPCVKENLKAFPLEIQENMDKRKPQQK